MNGEKAVVRLPIHFSDADIEAICAAVPKNCGARRLKMLPRILRDWSSYELLEHFILFGPEMRAKFISQDLAQKQIIRCARKLVDAFRDFDGQSERELSLRIVGWPKTLTYTESEVDKSKEMLEVLRRSLLQLADACKDRPPTPHGRTEMTKPKIMLDIQGLYQYLTGRAATRRVHNQHHGDPGKEYGPFWEFARAVWRAIYRSESDLNSAMKNWASRPDEHRQSIILLSNIHIRHPEWGLFPKSR